LLEADLERYYGRDLAEEFDRAGCRKLWVWISGLPPEAATSRIGGQQWTVRDELLAVNAELADQWGLILARLHCKKGALDNYTPLRVQRPSEPGQRKSPPPEQKQPEKKDRYQKSRERAAFFS
jgi:hypothetical protein